MIRICKCWWSFLGFAWAMHVENGDPTGNLFLILVCHLVVNDQMQIQHLISITYTALLKFLHKYS